MSKKVSDINALNETFCGSPDYLSPEVIRKVGYNYMRDVFSLGVLAYELLHGVTPFYADEIREIYTRILTDSPEMAPNLSPDCVSFMKACMEKDQTKRLGFLNGMDDVLSHPWLRTVVYQLNKENAKLNPLQALLLKKPLFSSTESMNYLNEYYQAASNATDESPDKRGGSEPGAPTHQRYFDFSFRQSVDVQEEFPDLDDVLSLKTPSWNMQNDSRLGSPEGKSAFVFPTEPTAIRSAMGSPELTSKPKIKMANKLSLHS